LDFGIDASRVKRLLTKMTRLNIGCLDQDQSGLAGTALD